MNCLNCGKYLKEAIDSVYAQTYGDWEIIFWDNASTDRSADIAKSYDEKMRYFRGEETIPLGAARNKALEQAKGKFIAFLDCDDLWMPTKLEKQIPLFADPEVGLVYSDVIHFNTKGDEFRLYDKVTFCRGMCFHQLLKNYSLSMPAVVIRKATLDQESEWFDPCFNLIEDYDLFMRIAYSWKLDTHQDVLAKYRVHKSSYSWTEGDLFYEEQIILLEKYRKLWPDFPDRRLWCVQKAIVDTLGKHDEYSVIVKTHPSTTYREPPIKAYCRKKGLTNCQIIRVERSLNDLLDLADVIVIDFPQTTLLQALTTTKPIFVYTGLLHIHEQAMRLLARRASCFSKLDEFQHCLDMFLNGDLNDSDVDLADRSFLECYGMVLKERTAGARVGEIVTHMVKHASLGPQHLHRKTRIFAKIFRAVYPK